MEGIKSIQSQDNPSKPTLSSAKRMSISLTGDSAQLLEFLADIQGVSQNEALRRAIATESYLMEERRQGSKVLLQKSDKEIREVVFR